jgi:hypothetical protein
METTAHKDSGYVEQLISFLKPGDVFRKPHSDTLYKLDEVKLNNWLVICENLRTHEPEQMYYNSPVLKLIF